MKERGESWKREGGREEGQGEGEGERERERENRTWTSVDGFP